MALALVFFSTTVAFCDCFEPCEKMYIAEEQAAITKKGIFVKLGEQWFQTEALFSDGNGVFIQNLNPSAYGCPDPYNACRNCGRCIHREFDICPYCEKPA
jgi:hypothetical protein